MKVNAKIYCLFVLYGNERAENVGLFTEIGRQNKVGTLSPESKYRTASLAVSRAQHHITS